MIKNHLKFFLIFTSIAIICSNAEAHQQKYATTTISLNTRTENLEIVHRFLVHDAEHVVKQLFTDEADFNNHPETQDSFANYVVEHFQLRLNDNAAPTVVIGFESDEKFFWVYQEVEQPDLTSRLDILQNALHEIWPRQVNLVNVEGFGEVKSVEFRKGDSWKSVDVKP
jgi:hypothetical protein